MKSFFLTGIAVLGICLPLVEVCAANSRGLVIYDEPPSTYAESLEYDSVTETSVAFATAVLTNGKKQEIARAGILAIIPYPPEAPTTSLPNDAAAAMKSIQTARAKYPQFTAKLDAALAKWANSLEFYRQRQQMAKAGSPVATPTLTLTVDGLTYTQVVLSSFDGVSVGIEHSAGAARIPAVKLKPDQITALNATASSVHIDSNMIVAEPPKVTPSPQSAPVAGRESVKLPSTPGSGIPLTRDQQSETRAAASSHSSGAKSSALPPSSESTDRSSVEDEGKSADATFQALLKSDDEAASERLITEAFKYSSITRLDSVPRSVCGPLLALKGVMDGEIKMSRSENGFYLGFIHADRIEWGSDPPVVLRADRIFAGIRNDTTGVSENCVLILAGNSIIELSPAVKPDDPQPRLKCWWWNDKSKNANFYLLK